MNPRMAAWYTPDVPSTHAERSEALVALAQVATCPGQFRHNLEQHLVMADRARRAGAALVLFPELSLSGYLLAHGVAEESYSLDDPRLAELRRLSREVTMLVGLPLQEERGGIANAAVLLEGGEVVGVHRKVYLPTYGMFDEGRFFMAGSTFRPVECSLGRFGILICEDAWHPATSTMLALQQVDALWMVAGGPTELGCESVPAGTRRWHSLVVASAATMVTPTWFVNRCGWEEGILFGGGSWAVDCLGRGLVEPASTLDEALVLAKLDTAATRHARSLRPIPVSERLDLWRATVEAHGA